MRTAIFFLSLLLTSPVFGSNLSSKSPGIECAEGNTAGCRVVHKFGRNPSVGAAKEIISTLATYWQPIAAETVRVKAGGNANDTAAGSGCREITIEGLDGSWAEASEAEATAGASASTATTTTFIRVFRAYCSSMGT